MQTFLPYPSFHESARALDYRRLGKQRVEALQICNVLTGSGSGWANHPAVRMWAETPLSLARYGMVISEVWIARGYRDTCYEKIRAVFSDFTLEQIQSAAPPEWLGDTDFHIAHQSNLVRKAPEFYGPIFPGVPDDLPYIWPVP